MQVVSLPERKARDPKELDRKRMAIQIAAQLPGDITEAILVLEATLVLVRTFLASDGS